MDTQFSSAKLNETLEEKDHVSFHNSFFFRAAFMGRKRKLKKTVPMTTVHTRYSESGAHETEDVEEHSWSEEDLDILGKTVKSFRKMLV